MNTANKLRIVNPDPDELEIRQPEAGTVRGDSRAIAVAKFRELADKLESGELDGARVQWRAPNADEKASGKPTEMVVVTVTPRTDDEWFVGTVQLTTTKIEEG